ncbi:TPA: RHS domain-containing protein [Acinetobacter baumannii]|nr:RHS domain-containing protein [Acinetobacter baumannii]HDR2204572.1 RHS domain-containing protein [Acinetobacter baumannii]
MGRLVRSRNNQYTADYRYDALGRGIQKRSKHHDTGQEQNIIYGWDGDTLAYESSADLTKHYLYEKDSFVPLLQAAYHHSIELHQTQDWTEKTYSIYKDPLWNAVKQSQGFDDVWFYHCDHLGTPQEMSNQTGAIVWKAQYKAWGECKVEQAKSDFFENSEIISNNILFQGQYYDGETGLHYNRYRYYSPYVGRFISKDPIELLGGSNIYVYAPSPVGWVDPLGLERIKSPKTIRYSQNGYSPCFGDGDRLAADPSYAAKVEPIRLVRFKDLPQNVLAKLLEQCAKSNMVYSLDNRRLAAAKQSKTGANTRWATPEEIQQEATLRRFSTNDAGKTICHN